MLHLFGDESFYEGVATYGLVYMNENDRGAVEQALVQVKLMFGGTAESRIHCKELFHFDARKKSPWKHLAPSDVFDLAIAVGNLLRLAGVRALYSTIDKDLLPDVLNGLMRASKDDKHGFRMNIPTGPKQLANLAYTAALARFMHVEFRLWVDPDTTKIDWGGRRRQASRVNFSFDRGTHSQDVIPEAIIGAKPVLLDVADIVAYGAAHTHSGSKRVKFNEVLQAFQAESMRMDIVPSAFGSQAP